MGVSANISAMSVPRLQVQDLTLCWDGSPVCEHISFDVAPGEIVGLIGRSGTGKTTIFHAIAGLTKPESGHVLLDGQDITGKAGKIGYMLQKDLLLEQHTIIDNVAMPLIVGGMAKRAARTTAAEHFSTFGLSGYELKYPFQLSGGMRQRAALLRTYMTGSNTILMDEPFSALDAFTRAEMRDVLVRTFAKTNVSFMLITHDVDEALAMCDQIFVLAGSSAQNGPSTIVGSVQIPWPRTNRDQFLLSSDCLQAKKAIFALLNSYNIDGCS